MANNYFTKAALARLVLARAKQINDIQDLLVVGFDKLPDPDRFKERNVEYIADTGAADAYVVTYPQPVPDAYATGMTIKTAVSNANTGACTINVNNLGAKNILLADGSTPAAGVLATGRVHTLIYDGTAFRVQATTTTVTPGDGTITAAKLASSLQNVIDLGGLTLTNGDILFYNSGSLLRLPIGSTEGHALQVSSGLPAWAAIAGVDVQLFSSSGTWNKPSAGTHTDVFCIGAGGGGGSGRVSASGVQGCGGAGGGGGGITHFTFLTSSLGASETVTVGAGGAGGASQTADSSDGNAGSNGGDTTFGSHATGSGGNGGDPGDTTSDCSGGAAGSGNWCYGQAGRFGTVSSSAKNNTTSVGSNYHSNLNWIGGGGGGGGINTGTSDADGGDVRYVQADGINYNTLAGGAAAGGAGSNGVSIGVLIASGGSGGGAHDSGNGGAGGDGANYGAGGGGGGATRDGFDSGAGGAGAGGYCIAITY